MTKTHVDTYSCFQELAKHQRAEQDYRIRLKDRHSPVTILAPHGGKIEPKTSKIARAIAGSDFNLYCFEGIKKTCNFEVLHITSHHFDEQQCIDLLSRSRVVVAIHGRQGKDTAIVVGGRNSGLKKILSQKLQQARFIVKEGSGLMGGKDKKNICNCGSTGEGVQFEFPKALRRNFNFRGFAKIVRDSIDSYLRADEPK